ncbi:hypothetical protein QD47_26245 [Paenibacillus terrae]|uniref:Uncharacterized protein n=1 Tax=Paenibacillus terrae TaxID=159743 RepID=A0A0D7WUE3_9BACL|nr:hypothetical protein QD47_26245 [Paenibacillus terrae]
MFKLLFIQYPGLQHFLDDRKDTFVDNSDVPEFLDEQAVVDIIKLTFDVSLDDPRCSVSLIGHTANCMFGRSVQSKTVGVFEEPGFCECLEYDWDAFLDDAINNGRNTERSQLSFCFSIKYRRTRDRQAYLFYFS